MRVNNINNLAFTRALEIKSNTNNIKNPDIDKATKDVIRTIQRKKTPYRSSQRSLLITFFSGYIGGIGKYGTQVDSAKIGGRVYLFTGYEALKAREIKAKAKVEKDRLVELYKTGARNNMSEAEQNALQNKEALKFLKQNIIKNRDKALLELVEDGKCDKDGRKKPLSFLTFNMKQDGKLDSVVYTSTLEAAKSGQAERSLFL